MTIRAATPYDLDQLVELGARFLEESKLPITYHPERARSAFLNAMRHPDGQVLVAVEGDVVAGIVILGYERDFTHEVCAYVEKLYVHAEFRGLGTADELVDAACAQAEAAGAAVMYAAATAGMGKIVERLFVRLFERHGFAALGRTLMRTF